jgi:DMSO/TMAO reductase YedYZ molybdopterin-dependent catalytic subunit
MGADILRPVDGAVAGAVQLGVAELAASLLPGARSPLSGTASAMIDATPGPAIDAGIALLETRDKAVIVATLVGGLAGASVVATRLGPAVPLAIGAGAGVAGATRGDSRALPSLAAGLAGGVAGALALPRSGGRPPWRRQAEAPHRTAALAALAAGTIAAAGARAATRRRHVLERRAQIRLPAPARPAPAPPAGAAFDDVAGISDLFTPVEALYKTDQTLPAPLIDPHGWRLRVHGEVDRELELSLDDLLAMDLAEHDATLICVHNPVGGDRIGSARWTGVPLADLLERAGPHPSARYLVARAVDGFTAVVPLEELRNGRVALVAVGAGGQPLPRGNGFPARLLIPGIYGYSANTKWLAEIELAADATGYWAKRGWPREPARVRPNARIDVPGDADALAPGPVTVAGVAWAPPDGVERVEVSVDGGPWQPAQLAAEVAPEMWRQWRFEWHAGEGAHELRVRTAGQPEALEPPYPHGSGGHHAISVDVGARGAGARRLRRELRAEKRRLLLAGRGLRAWLR